MNDDVAHVFVVLVLVLPLLVEQTLDFARDETPIPKCKPTAES